MKTVKKWLCLCLALALVGTLGGCAGDPAENIPGGTMSGDASTVTDVFADGSTGLNGTEETSQTNTDTTETGEGPTTENVQGSGESNNDPTGTKENPAPMVIGANTVTLNGSGDFYYSWIATEDVALVLQFSGESKTGWAYRVENLTAGTEFTKASNSSADSVDSTTYISAFKGDKIQVAVNTKTGAAGKVTVDASLLEEWGAEDNPIPIAVGETNYLRVPAGKTVYFSGRTQNTTMTLTGASNSVLEFDGDSYSFKDGKLTLKMPKSQGGQAEVLEFALTNNTGKMQVYSITCRFPVGTTDYPDKVNLGSNSVQIEAGSQYGYVYEWTATAKGTVTITMTGSNWHYEILNINSIVQEQSTSDLDTPEKEATVAVKKGQVVRITINTSNGKADKVTFNFQFD